MLVLFLHATAIALVLLARTGARLQPTPGLAAFNLATGGARPEKSHPNHPQRATARLRPTPITPLAIDLTSIRSMQPSLAALPSLVTQPASFAAGAGCDLTQPVQDALRRNVELNNHLSDIPEDRRSIANAIVVWNARWTDPGPPSLLAFAAIRQTITQTVLAASAACRSQPQTGPRLIYLPGDAGKTAILAVGSGQWTWQQVIDGVPSLPAATDAAQFAAVPSAPLPAATLQPARSASARSSEPSDLRALLASLVRGRSPTEQPFYP
jgi:hypothetical protein